MRYARVCTVLLDRAMDLPAVILQKDGLMCSMITVEYVAELRLNALQNYG